MEIKEIMTCDQNKEKVDKINQYYENRRKYYAIREFVISTRDKTLKDRELYKLENLFNKLNSIIFAGFDYYYMDDFNKLFEMEKAPKEVDASFDLLVNEDHINKLRTTIDCFENIDFVSYKSNDYIWYKGTNVKANIVPFERTEENDIIIKRPGKEKAYVFKEEVERIDSQKNKEYNELEYKLFR